MGAAGSAGAARRAPRTSWHLVAKAQLEMWAAVRLSSRGSRSWAPEQQRHTTADAIRAALALAARPVHEVDVQPPGNLAQVVVGTHSAEFRSQGLPKLDTRSRGGSSEQRRG